jgi:hypothetical protein
MSRWLLLLIIGVDHSYAILLFGTVNLCVRWLTLYSGFEIGWLTKSALYSIGACTNTSDIIDVWC